MFLHSLKAYVSTNAAENEEDEFVVGSKTFDRNRNSSVAGSKENVSEHDCEIGFYMNLTDDSLECGTKEGGVIENSSFYSI